MALDRLDQVSARARNLSDLVTTSVDVTLAQVSLQQNEDMRRISAWVAIAMAGVGWALHRAFRRAGWL